MHRRAGARRILGWTMVVAGAALGAPPGTVQAQARTRPDQECRCVDEQGQPIERCACIRTPNFDWAMGPRPWNRARIGVGVAWDRPETDGDLTGVRVLSVLEGGPAEQAGLRRDDIITRVGGRSLFDPLDDSSAEARLDLDRSVPAQRLVALLGDLDPGEGIEIEYVRDGETRTVTVTAEPNVPEMAGLMRGPGGGLGSMRIPRVNLGSDWPRTQRDLAASMDPCFRSDSGGPSFFGGPCIDGVDLAELNPELAEYFGTSDGVLVIDVRRESTLAVQPGDVIVAIDGREVTSPEHARRVLESYDLDEELTLRIVRHGEVMEVVGRRR